MVTKGSSFRPSVGVTTKVLGVTTARLVSSGGTSTSLRRMKDYGSVEVSPGSFYVENLKYPRPLELESLESLKLPEGGTWYIVHLDFKRESRQGV